MKISGVSDTQFLGAYRGLNAGVDAYVLAPLMRPVAHRKIDLCPNFVEIDTTKLTKTEMELIVERIIVPSRAAVCRMLTDNAKKQGKDFGELDPTKLDELFKYNIMLSKTYGELLAERQTTLIVPVSKQDLVFLLSHNNVDTKNDRYHVQFQDKNGNSTVQPINNFARSMRICQLTNATMTGVCTVSVDLTEKLPVTRDKTTRLIVVHIRLPVEAATSIQTAIAH